ncbi:Hypothetical predicted protein [Cloeon dipterum]|uniref:L-Fucosyltransferase n=1 Tax=Cloeon dipterum TaxID=197152 RepID=A0A8S1BWC0_9INSE|nr:Hypothetical predicted protein [Cloeon dipterum]
MRQARCFHAFVLFFFIFWVALTHLGFLKLDEFPSFKELPATFTIDALNGFVWQEENNGTGAKRLTCPKGPTVTVEDGLTGLGNQIWEYAQAWAAAKILDRPGFVSESLARKLKVYFPNIEMPTIEEISHCNVTKNATYMKMHVDVKTLKESYKGVHVRIPQYDMLPELILPYRDKLRDEIFKFHDEILERVQKTIHSFDAENLTKVVLHVRRSDYIGLIAILYKLSPAHSSFYLDAMDWFRKNIGGQLIFMIVTDDIGWCEKNLLIEKDVVIASDDTGHDLALLSIADHNIIDYGSFGMWAGVMSKGHTIALIDIDFNGIMTKFKNWHVFDESKYTSKLEFEP